MTSSRRTNRQAGFSLLEVLIGVSLFSVALITIAVALDSSRHSYIRGETKIDVQQNARVALGEMAREIRMAGYFPENFASTPASPLLVNPVQIATDSALAIHGDVDDTDTSSVVLFCLDGTTLRRGSAADGDSAAYWCPATEALADNITSLRFTYFDENNAAIPTAVAPYALDGEAEGTVPDVSDLTERGAVRRVKITLTATEDVFGQEPQVYTLGSEVRLRNVR